MTPRIAAYETLLLCEKEKQFSNIAVNNGITKYRFEGRDRDFYTQLVYGVIEKRLTIDYFIEQYTRKSIKRLDKPVVIILRLSFYQIYFLDRVPNSAAVSEGVKLASRFASRAKGYVNAILRRASETTPSFPDKSDLAQYLSIVHSVSKYICSLLLSQYPQETDSILEAYNTIPKITFQVNAARSTPEDFIKTYRLDAHPVPPLPFAVKMAENLSLSNHPAIQNGDAFVQDVASQLIALVLDPQPSDAVIDVCSCPGGKSFSAANLMASRAAAHLPNGRILACDLHESKLPLVQNGAKRLGFSFIDTCAHDATQPIEQYRASFDRVICDVPCSGLGVIAKKPEIRYKDIAEIHALPELQLQILSSSTEYLRENGILVYSTCTVNKNENEEVVNRFLASHPDYALEDFTFASDGRSFVSQNGCLTLLPSSEYDGFFMAKLRKLH